jgi:hypothetical protein
MSLPSTWPGADGKPISCREKLKVLAENHAEARQALQDAFEDAILMGVDEAAMRRILHDLVEGLASPKRRA